MSGLWDTFMKRLDEAGKLDEFCNLDADDVDGWLEANGMGLSRGSVGRGPAQTPVERQ